MRKKVELTAVWDDDLHALLNSLGVLDDLIAGNTGCVVCSRIVNFDNLGAIMPSVASVQVTCDNSGCVRVATSQDVPV